MEGQMRGCVHSGFPESDEDRTHEEREERCSISKSFAQHPTNYHGNYHDSTW